MRRCCSYRPERAHSARVVSPHGLYRRYRQNGAALGSAGAEAHAADAALLELRAVDRAAAGDGGLDAAAREHEAVRCVAGRGVLAVGPHRHRDEQLAEVVVGELTDGVLRVL